MLTDDYISGHVNFFWSTSTCIWWILEILHCSESQLYMKKLSWPCGAMCVVSTTSHILYVLWISCSVVWFHSFKTYTYDVWFHSFKTYTYSKVDFNVKWDCICIWRVWQVSLHDLTWHMMKKLTAQHISWKGVFCTWKYFKIKCLASLCLFSWQE